MQLVYINVSGGRGGGGQKAVKHRDIIPETFCAFRFQNYYLWNSFALGGQRTLRGNVV